jgi:hypothetical protein
MKKIWFLQKNKEGTLFWDSYIHNECKLLDTTLENPFEKQKQRIFLTRSREAD